MELLTYVKLECEKKERFSGEGDYALDKPSTDIWVEKNFVTNIR